MKKVLSFCIFSMLLAVLSFGVKAQTPSGLTLSPANIDPQVGVQDTVYLIPGSCFDALGLADNDKISIEWEILKDGSRIGIDSLTMYFEEFKFETKYKLGAAERWWGESYTDDYCYNGNGFGSFPGAYTPMIDSMGPECTRTGHFNITLPGQSNPYEFDYFFVRFFKDASNTAHRLIFKPREAASYQIVLHIYRRCNGTKWDAITCNNDQRYYVGGHHAELCGLISSDTLKPMPDTMPREVSICIGQTYTIFDGHADVVFDHDTTGALVPIYGISACSNSIDSVIDLTLHIIDPLTPVLDTNNSVLQICDGGQVTLTAVPQNVGSTGMCIWYDAMDNVIDTNNTINVNITANTEFYVRSYNPEGGCTSLDSLRVFAEVFASPAPFLTADTTEQCAGGSFTINLDQPYDGMTWFHDGAQMTETGVSFTISPAQLADSGNYYATVVDTNYHSVYGTMVACSAGSDTITLVVYDHAEATVSTFDGIAAAADNGIFCMTETNHEVTATITGGTAPYVLTWSNTEAYVTYNATGDTVIFNSTVTCDTTTYVDTLVSGVDAHNCSINLTGLLSIAYTLEDTDVPHIYMNGDTAYAAPSTSTNCSYLMPDVTPLVDSVTDACGTVTFEQTIAANTEILNDTTVWVRATDNCGHMDSVEVTILVQPNYATVTISTFDGDSITAADNGIFCMSEVAHEVNATITDGTAPYTLVWSNTAATHTIAGNIATATYNTVETCDTVKITDTIISGVDARGCEIYLGSLIDIFYVLEDTDVPHIYMNGTDTTAAPAYVNACTYLIPDVTPLVDSVTDACGTVTFVQSIAAGTQIERDTTLWVVATDNCGHKDSVEITVTIPFVHVSATDSVFQHVICSGDANGIIDVMVADGVRPYTVTVTLASTTTSYTQTGGYDADTTFRFGGLVKGEWAVDIVDANGCTAQADTLDVSSPNILELTTANETNLKCWKDSTGSFEYTLTGGSMPYAVKIEGPVASTDTINDNVAHIVDHLAAGTYTITVIDDHDCKDTVEVILTEPDSLQITSITVLNNVRCYGENNGNITATVAGGTTDYVYTWLDTNSNVVSTSTKADVNDTTGRILYAGEYTLHVTDANNCPCVDRTETITQHDTLEVVSIVTPNAIECPYQGTYDVTATVAGGTTNHTFNWNVNGTDISIASNSNLNDTYTYTEGSPVVCDTTFNIVFTVTDDSLCVATKNADQFRIVDNTNPVIAGTIADTMVIGCNRYAATVPAPIATVADLINLGITSVDDNCTTVATEFVVTYTDDTTDIACVDKAKASILRTYRVTDKCGNYAETSYKITVKDTVAPTFTRPVDITVYKDSTCLVDTTVAATGDVTDEADNCSTGLVATYADVVTPSACPNEFVVTRTWSLVDECGNAADDQVQTITVLDTIHPWFTKLPKDTVSYCDEDNYTAIRAAFEAYPQYKDNCATVTLDVTLDYIDTLCNDKTTVEHYAFTLTDACGLTTIDSAVIRTIDREAPRLTMPWNDVTLYDCATSDSIYEAWRTNVHFVDDCNNANADTIDYYGDRTPGCAMAFTEEGRWVLTDGCNTDTIRSIFQIIDETAPYFDVLPEVGIAVECDGIGNIDSLKAWINKVHATDACDPNVSLSMYYEDGGVYYAFDTTAAGLLPDHIHYKGWIQVNPGSDCNGYYKITWVAVDCSGNGGLTTVNPATTVEYFYITDNAGPVFTAPAPDTVDCSNWEAEYSTWLNVLDAYDVCSDHYFSVDNDSISQNFYNGCSYRSRNLFGTAYIHFRSEDNCGKVTNHTSSFTVLDTVAPVLTFAHGTSLDTLKLNYDPADCTPTAVLPAARTWHLDTVAPAAGNVYHDLASLQAAETELASITDIQDCAWPAGVITIKRDVAEYVSETSCEKTYRLPYTVRDHCGNTCDTIYQIVVIGDTTKPKAQDISTGDIFMTSTCNITLPTYSTYTELNAHGANITDCPSNTELTVAPVDTVGSGSLAACDSTVTVTYRITDNCGNYTEIKDVITIKDTTAPVIANAMPKDTVYMKADCSGLTSDTTARYAALADYSQYGARGWAMTITDCSDFTITRQGSVVNTADCPEKTILTTFKVTDPCGNFSTFVDTLIITDTVKPVITATIVDTVFDYLTSDCNYTVPTSVLDIDQYSELYALNNLYTVDECRLDSAALVMDGGDTTDNGCNVVVRYFYKVKDLCGNISDDHMILCVKFSDTVRPKVVAASVDNDSVRMTDDCHVPVTLPYWTTGADALAHGYTITDCNIDENTVVLTHGTYTEEPEGCNNIKVTVPYTLKDECGNESATFYQYIIAVDSTAPVVNTAFIHDSIVYLKEDCTFEVPSAILALSSYSDLYEYNHGYTVEECKLDSTVLIADGADTSAPGCTRVINYYYKVQDACGNISADHFTVRVSVEDTTAPAVSNATLNDSVRMPDYPTCGVPAVLPYWADTAAAIAHGCSISDCNLDATTFTHGTYTIDDQGCYIKVTVPYTIADSCGNVSAEFYQYIIVSDSTAPVVPTTILGDNFTMNEAAGSNCIYALPAAYTTVADVQAHDATFDPGDCNIDGTCTVTLKSADTTGLNTCTVNVVRHYTVTDKCGNESDEFTQTFVVKDNTAPTLNFTELSDSVSYMEDFSGCDLNASPEYTSVAAMLNIFTSLTVRDCNLDDVMTCVADTTYDAAGLAPYVARIHRVYTIADSCGHSTDFTHDIYVLDTFAPIITMVETDVNTGLPKVQDSLLYTTASDCAPVVPVAFANVADVLLYPGVTSIEDCQLKQPLTYDETISTGTCPDTVTRIYTVVDSTGNESKFVQYVFTYDTVKPVIVGTIPEDTVTTDANCEFDLSPVLVYTSKAELEAIPGFTITDCHDVTVTYTDDTTRNGAACMLGNYVTRTYKITDKCNNFSEIDQIIRIKDATAPTLDIASFGFVKAVAVGNCVFKIPDFTDSIANHYEDNCTSAPYEVTQTPGEGTVITDTTVVTVTYKDTCGNSSTIDVTVVTPAPLAVYLTTDSVSCHSMEDGIIHVVNQGGTAPYKDSLVFAGARVTDGMASGANYDFTDLAAGNYTVYVIDADGCKVNKDTIVEQPDTLTVTLTIDNDHICSHGTNAHTTLNTIINDAGTPNYNLTWDLIPLATNDTVYNAITALYDQTSTNYSYSSVNMDTLEVGYYKYFVTVTDQRGCSDTASVEFYVAPTHELHDTARVCFVNLPYNWVGHRLITVSEVPVTDSVYTLYDSLLTTDYSCDSVWVLHLTVTDNAYLMVRDRNNNADASTLIDGDICATVQTGNYAATEKGFEIFVNRNCMNCSNVKVGLRYTIYQIVGDAEYQITSDVDDYFTPTYLSYMDQYSLNPQTITTAPVNIPSQYPTIGMGGSAGNHYQYFNMCWLTPEYGCSFSFLTNSGIGYAYGRPHTIGFTQFRMPGEYRIQVDLVVYSGGTDWGGEGYCHADGKVGGDFATATSNVLSSLNIFLTVEGMPLSAATPMVDPMEGIVLASEVAEVPEANVFPNPATDNISIELKGFAGETAIMLTNANGMTVETINVNIESNSTPIIRINTSDYAQGVYMVTARSNDAIVTKRVVIVK